MSARLRRACEGKIKHDTQAAATDHMMNLIRQGAARLAAYKCKVCKKWHVGHKPRPRKNR